MLFRFKSQPASNWITRFYPVRPDSQFGPVWILSDSCRILILGHWSRVDSTFQKKANVIQMKKKKNYNMWTSMSILTFYIRDKIDIRNSIVNYFWQILECGFSFPGFESVLGWSISSSGRDFGSQNFFCRFRFVLWFVQDCSARDSRICDI